MDYAKKKRYEKNENFRNSFSFMSIEALVETLKEEKSKTVLYSLRNLLIKPNLSEESFNSITIVAENGITANNRKMAFKVLKKHFPERLNEIDIEGKVLSGWVYFVFNPHSRLTKIGLSTNLAKRTSYLQKQWLVDLELLGSIKTHKFVQLESKYHQFYNQYRIRRGEYRDSTFNPEYSMRPFNTEWFKLPEDHISNLRNGKFPFR